MFFSPQLNEAFFINELCNFIRSDSVIFSVPQPENMTTRTSKKRKLILVASLAVKENHSSLGFGLKQFTDLPPKTLTDK